MSTTQTVMLSHAVAFILKLKYFCLTSCCFLRVEQLLAQCWPQASLPVLLVSVSKDLFDITRLQNFIIHVIVYLCSRAQPVFVALSSARFSTAATRPESETGAYDRVGLQWQTDVAVVWKLKTLWKKQETFWVLLLLYQLLLSARIVWVVPAIVQENTAP